MGKAGDEEELKEDEPDPIQVGRLSNSTHLCSLNLSVDSSSSGEARDESQEYDIELSPRLNASITTLAIVDLEGGFDNSSEEKGCAHDVSNDAKRKGHTSKDKESKYDEEAQEKKEKETRRRKDVAAAGLVKAMTRVAKARTGDTKKKAKKSKGQYPRPNIKESASVFEVLVKADIFVARRHGKVKAADKGERK